MFPRQPSNPLRIQVKRFLGFNNVEDPLNLGLKWFVQADNIVITENDKIERVRGFAPRTTNTSINGSYATKDQKRFYVIDGGELRAMHPDLYNGTPTWDVLATGLEPRRFAFEEVNGVVYATNGVNFLVIDNEGVRPWGIPSPPSPALGLASGNLAPGIYQMVATYVDARGLESSNSDPVSIELDGAHGLTIASIPQHAYYNTNIYLTTANGTIFFLIHESAPAAINWNGGELGPEIPFWMTDVPRGTRPAHFKGAMYVAEWFPELDKSVIWKSLDLAYHHFDWAAEGLGVPGRVLMLRATPQDDALLCGTERGIFSYGIDGRITPLADYGVIPGEHVTVVHHQLYFWTERGLCRAHPFLNLSERRMSVAPGLHAAGQLIEQRGMRRYVVALHRGGTPFNRREPS